MTALCTNHFRYDRRMSDGERVEELCRALIAASAQGRERLLQTRVELFAELALAMELRAVASDLRERLAALGRDTPNSRTDRTIQRVPHQRG
jgi:hypothetical protein